MSKGRPSRWKIPVQRDGPGYKRMLAACKHYGKPYPELTEEEREWKKPGKIPKENRDDLFFLADALKMAADAMIQCANSMDLLIVELRKIIEEAKQERGTSKGPQ